MNPLSSSFSEPTGPPEWKEVFDDPLLPLMVDIGCGSGRFLIWHAKNSGKSQNYLGLEIRQKVNRIRELPQNSKIIATHTNSPDVLIWDVEAQPNRHVLGASESRPDLILIGHKEIVEFVLAMCPAEPYVLSGGKWQQEYNDVAYLGESPSEASEFIELAQLPESENFHRTVLIWDVEAQPNRHAVLGASESRPDLEIVEFALAMCPAEPYVLSEGKDKSVVLWSIQDHISALGDSSSSPGASDSKQSVKTTNEKESPKVDPRGIFHGHDSRVEDVQFYPSR
ncbi:hypothetical protein ZEAMMB73_Zm00001d043832 [Zea mays]|uniref:Uncharacterized protein n=1 Tax=Zea mays TaxID=4577 RepID=A0A1D6NFB9_MAIZE|nr:hypothetical protein ZEAMMB73_Zm00001d043832 [Zea mays]